MAVWIADRAYARSLLLQQSEQEQRPYIVRGRKETIITYQGRRMKLGQLHAPPGRALRYPNVLYHSHRKVPVDIIVYYDLTYEEPWYLLVPVAFRSLLETDFRQGRDVRGERALSSSQVSSFQRLGGFS